MRLDHGGKNIVHGQRCLACGNGGTREPVGRGQDTAQVVRGVAPFGGQPRVIEIEPANHRADVKGRLNRVKLKLCTGHFGAVRDCGARYDGPQQFCAGRVFQCFQAAAQGVDQAVACRFVGQVAVNGVIQNIIGNVA